MPSPLTQRRLICFQELLLIHLRRQMSCDPLLRGHSQSCSGTVKCQGLNSGLLYGMYICQPIDLTLQPQTTFISVGVALGSHAALLSQLYLALCTGLIGAGDEREDGSLQGKQESSPHLLSLAPSSTYMMLILCFVNMFLCSLLIRWNQECYASH